MQERVVTDDPFVVLGLPCAVVLLLHYSADADLKTSTSIFFPTSLKKKTKSGLGHNRIGRAERAGGPPYRVTLPV